MFITGALDIAEAQRLRTEARRVRRLLRHLSNEDDWLALEGFADELDERAAVIEDSADTSGTNGPA
jgi:hypothetical protein